MSPRIQWLTPVLLACAILAACVDAHSLRDNDRDRATAWPVAASHAAANAADAREVGRQDALIAFLESAAPDQVGYVEDPVSQARIRVIAGNAYHAASGRLCRRYFVPPFQEGSTIDSGLVCQDGSGRWTRSRVRINPDLGADGGNAVR
jgi:hypothetical protein